MDDGVPCATTMTSGHELPVSELLERLWGCDLDEFESLCAALAKRVPRVTPSEAPALAEALASAVQAHLRRDSAAALLDEVCGSWSSVQHLPHDTLRSLLRVLLRNVRGGGLSGSCGGTTKPSRSKSSPDILRRPDLARKTFGAFESAGARQQMSPRRAGHDSDCWGADIMDEDEEDSVSGINLCMGASQLPASDVRLLRVLLRLIYQRVRSTAGKDSDGGLMLNEDCGFLGACDSDAAPHASNGVRSVRLVKRPGTFGGCTSRGFQRGPGASAGAGPALDAAEVAGGSGTVEPWMWMCGEAGPEVHSLLDGDSTGSGGDGCSGASSLERLERLDWSQSIALEPSVDADPTCGSSRAPTPRQDTTQGSDAAGDSFLSGPPAVTTRALCRRRQSRSVPPPARQEDVWLEDYQEIGTSSGSGTGAAIRGARGWGRDLQRLRPRPQGLDEDFQLMPERYGLQERQLQECLYTQSLLQNECLQLRRDQGVVMCTVQETARMVAEMHSQMLAERVARQSEARQRSVLQAQMSAVCAQLQALTQGQTELQERLAVAAQAPKAAAEPQERVTVASRAPKAAAAPQERRRPSAARRPTERVPCVARHVPDTSKGFF